MAEKMTKPLIDAVAYARFSSNHQRDESIDAQLRDIRSFAKSNGIRIIAEYADKAFSARSDQRPDFQRMIKDAKEHKFQVVIVHKLDRFSRDRYDSAFYKRELKKHGVKILSVTEKLDDSPESVMLESVIEGVAEYYSKNLGRETMKGLKENAYNGKHTGGLAPLGYRVDPVTKRVEIDPNEAGAVRMIFEMAASGAHYPEIVDKLNANGYRTKTGREFSSSGLHEILKNQKYIGICVYNKRVSQDVCNSSRRFKDESEWIVRTDVFPPLVDEDVFNLVQERLRKRQVSGQAHPKEVYLLSGKIRCGICGTAYCGERKRSGKGIISHSYFCNSRNRGHGSSCGNPSINRSLIESYVLERLSEYVFSDSLIPDIVGSYNRYLREQNGTAMQRLDELAKENSSLQSKINSTIELLIETKSAALKDKLALLEARQAAVQAEITELNSGNIDRVVTEEQLKAAFFEIRECLTNGTLHNVKRLIDAYVHEVLVYPEKVVVVFNMFPHIKFPKKQDEESPDEGLSSVAYPEVMSDELCRKRYDSPDFVAGSRVLDRIRGLSGEPP